MEERVTFISDGLKLSGIVHIPPDLGPGERRPAFLILHGFGSSKDGAGGIALGEHLANWGYVAMRFDHRGCGESEGERGRIFCLDQVDDTMNAVTYMAGRSDVDPERIGAIGSSFGGAVAVYTGGVDQRIAAVVSVGGWGDGARKFRRQHPTPEAWDQFITKLEEGRRHRKATGKSLMMPRYDIVPIPPHLRQHMTAASFMEFPVETAQSMYDFRADDVVANISPRPLLLLHAANDSVTPKEESIEMFMRAKSPTELHLLADVDHFTFNEANQRLWNLLGGWLERYFPVRTAVRA